MNGWDDVLAKISFFLFFFGPVNLVALVGAIFAVMRLRRYGKPARLVAIGAGLILFSTALFIVSVVTPVPASRLSIISHLSRKTIEIGGFGLWMTVLSVGIGFIMWAAVIDRHSLADAESE